MSDFNFDNRALLGELSAAMLETSASVNELTRELNPSRFNRFVCSLLKSEIRQAEREAKFVKAHQSDVHVHQHWGSVPRAIYENLAPDVIHGLEDMGIYFQNEPCLDQVKVKIIIRF